MNSMRISLLLLLGLALFLGDAWADMTAMSLDGQWQSTPNILNAGKTAKWFDPAKFSASTAMAIQVWVVS
jgi:hypothetical protein